MSDDGWIVPPPRPINSPLVRAFAISLLFHLLLLGTYQTGKRFGLWEKDAVPAWLQKAEQVLKGLPPIVLSAEPKPPERQEVELMFVDVNPNVATPEPPKEAKYYSSRNALAANPDPKKDTLNPELDGKQVHVVKTESIPKNAPPPTPAPVTATPPRKETPPPKEPTPPKEPEGPKDLAATEAKPKAVPAAGDLTPGKPEPKPRDGKIADTAEADGKGTEAKTQPRQRPRTLAQVQQAQPPKAAGLAGEKMKQEGGVKRSRIAASLDTKSTPFGAYDEALIAAIQNRWWALIDEQQFARDASGTVVVEFRLYYDGTIRVPPEVTKCTVGYLLSYLCQRAVSDPAPYAPWPSDMRTLVGQNYRDVRFTFIYE